MRAAPPELVRPRHGPGSECNRTQVLCYGRAVFAGLSRAASLPSCAAPEEVDFADPPEWLIELLEKPQRQGSAPPARGSREGARGPAPPGGGGFARAARSPRERRRRATRAPESAVYRAPHDRARARVCLGRYDARPRS